MVRIIGIKAVICTCGEPMLRTGGVFSSGTTFSTYLCKQCNKAVNVYDLPEEEAKRLKEEI